jgi:23S rRNA pseudouridine2605 synthase
MASVPIVHVIIMNKDRVMEAISHVRITIILVLIMVAAIVHVIIMNKDSKTEAISHVRTIIARISTKMANSLKVAIVHVRTIIVRVITMMATNRKVIHSSVRVVISHVRADISHRMDISDGYQPRQGGYQPRQGGYQQRQGGYQQRQGGYQQRQGGYQPRQGGYRPRYNNDGEDGGYQQRPNYRPRYNNDGGGYNRGGYNQGGYRQHTADYDPNAKYSLKKRIEYKEEHTDPNEPIRLNKYLANAGVCSRREADEFIQNGVVTVNGEVVKELGTKVKRSDAVVFNGQPVSIEKKVYVLLNKPKDCVTTSDDPEQRKTVMDLVKDACPERIYPVGRLDRNTTGVLLLTNDGDLASKLTHPKFLKKKVYQVVLDKPVTEFDMQKIAEGIELEDGEVHADAIEYPDEMDKSKVGIEIHSGKNRIVRRIFESLGYRVIRLDRVQFAGLTKKNVRRGDWRFLTEKEVEMLRMGAFE